MPEGAFYGQEVCASPLQSLIHRNRECNPSFWMNQNLALLCHADARATL